MALAILLFIMVETYFTLFIFLFKLIVASPFLQQFFLLGCIFGIINSIFFRWFL